MTDLANAEPASTVIEADTAPDASGGGAPRTLTEPDAKPSKEPSLRDTIAAAVKDSDAKEPADKDADADKGEKAKESEKPEGEKTPKDAPKEVETNKKERGPDGKFAAKDAKDAAEPEAGNAKPDAKPEPADKGRHIEPPAKFLPDAKETWRNTPRAVQRDVENMAREHEAEVTRYREAAERYEPIRQFDEAARQSGRAGAHESLREVAELEDMMAKNPLAAINQILLRAGPRKPDGSPVSLREFAGVVARMDEAAYGRAVQPAQQQTPQNDNPRIQELESRLAQMQQQQVAMTVIEPFKRDHPRYDELQGHIAAFLKSDMIPASLSPHDRLAAAYDMAVRVNPASHAEPQAQADPDPGDRAVEDLSGSKSIKSAPGTVSPDMEPERDGSIRDTLRTEFRRAGFR